MGSVAEASTVAEMARVQPLREPLKYGQSLLTPALKLRFALEAGSGPGSGAKGCSGAGEEFFNDVAPGKRLSLFFCSFWRV